MQYLQNDILEDYPSSGVSFSRPANYLRRDLGDEDAKRT
jgi:hypothetical protein